MCGMSTGFVRDINREWNVQIACLTNQACTVYFSFVDTNAVGRKSTGTLNLSLAIDGGPMSSSRLRAKDSTVPSAGGAVSSSPRLGDEGSFALGDGAFVLPQIVTNASRFQFDGATSSVSTVGSAASQHAGSLTAFGDSVVLPTLSHTGVDAPMPPLFNKMSPLSACTSGGDFFGGCRCVKLIRDSKFYFCNLSLVIYIEKWRCLTRVEYQAIRICSSSGKTTCFKWVQDAPRDTNL